MPVPGFEQQTFMCSQCRDVEQRLVFTKHDRAGDARAMPEQTPAPAVTATQDAPDAAPGPLARSMESPATSPLEPTRTEPVERTQIAPTETIAPLETTQTTPVEPTPPLRARMTVWARALEKLQTFKERAVETERSVQFNRVWDSLRPVSPSSDSFEATSDATLDEGVASPAASSSPAECDEHSASESKS
jgi:hypothetical protein